MKDFLRWWLGQLRDLLPAGLRTRLRSDQPVLGMDLRKHGVELSAGRQDGAQRLGPLDPQALSDDEETALQQFLGGLPQAPERILVRVQAGRFLQREVELPLAAEENLSEAISFQIDSLTPFSADQVLSFCGILKRIPAEKTLRAWLVVTPAAPVDNALGLLGDATPVPIGFPRRPPAPGEPLELTFRARTATTAARVGVPALAVVLLLAVLGAASYLHITNRVAERDLLESRLEEVRGRALEAATLQETIDGVKSRADDLGRRHAARTSLVGLLDDVTRRLGDDTWLQRIDIRDGEVVFQGISESATNLIAELEASPFLADVRFQSSVTSDRRYPGDRFSISARLVTQAEAGS